MFELPCLALFGIDDFLLMAVMFVGGQILSALTTKVPDAAPPSGLGEFTFPTADESRPIPILTGTLKQAGPNVIWYGNLRIKPKTQKVKTSLFSSKTVTVGYYYYLGMQMALAQGPCILRRIWVGDTLIWEGTQSEEGDILINTPDPTPKGIKIPGWGIHGSLYWHMMWLPAEQPDPPSGVLRFYPGNQTQTADPYLSEFQDPCPGYRGMCHVVWDGYLGESTSIEPWSFEITRIPNGLGLGDATVNTVDANPMNKLYEILTDVYGYTDADIDLVGFAAAAAVLKAEGNGFSLMEDVQRQASDIIQVISQQINGHLYLDPVTGKWKIELARGDYEPEELPVLDESNVTQLVSFDRGTWTGTTNVVRISFNNRENDYTDSSGISQDMANMQIQGQRISTSLDMPGVRNATLASMLAWRELRTLSYPLASARVKVNRTAWNAYVSKPYLFAFGEWVSAPIPMRVTKINLGGPDNPDIELDLIQDVFFEAEAGFAAPASGWTAPDPSLVEFTDRFIQEAPYAMLRRDSGSGEQARLWLAAVSMYRGELGYRVLVDGNDSGVVYGFAVKAELTSGVSATNTDISITTPIEAAAFSETTPEGVGQNLTNLILIGDELVAPLDTINAVDGLDFSNCLRGLCDTTEQTHVAGEVVWLLCLGSGLSSAPIYPGDDNVDVKMIPLTDVAEMDPADVAADNLTLNYRTWRPYPPTQLEMNSDLYPATVDIDSGVAVSFNRRDFRIYDESSQLTVDAATINADFPTNNSTQYRAIFYDGEAPVIDTGWNAGEASFAAVTRNKILRYYIGIPSDLTVKVYTRHTYESVVYESLYVAEHTATAYSTLLAGDVFLGVLDTEQVGTAWEAPSTGDYDFTLEIALAGDVIAIVNGGAPQTIISSGNTEGTLTGITASDIIEIWHEDSASSDEVFLEIDSPSHTEDAYAVLIFEGLLGGFGRGGFGRDMFGR